MTLMIILPAAISTSKVTCSASSQLGWEGIADSPYCEKQYVYRDKEQVKSQHLLPQKNQGPSVDGKGAFIVVYRFYGGLPQSLNTEIYTRQKWVGT